MANPARYQILAEGGVFDLQTRSIVRPSKSDPAWLAYQAALTAGEVPLPPDAVGQLDLAAAKAARTEEINAYSAGLRNSVIRGRSAGEMASWIIKLLDAMAVQAGTPTPFAALLPQLGTALGLPAAPTSVNAALATVRGISEADHVAKVLAPAVQFLVAEVALDAIRGKHCDAIAAMTDIRDVIAYNWRAGWPAIPGA